MTVADQIKILDRKIKQNEAKYDLDRKTAKICTLSSKNLKKYKYLTGEDLGYEPGALEKEYSLFGEVFNKGLDEGDQKEGFLKNVKNIWDKSEELLKAIKGKTNTKSQIDLFNEEFWSSETIALLKEIEDIGDNVDYEELFFTSGNNKNSLKNFKTSIEAN